MEHIENYSLMEFCFINPKIISRVLLTYNIVENNIWHRALKFAIFKKARKVIFFMRSFYVLWFFLQNFKRLANLEYAWKNFQISFRGKRNFMRFAIIRFFVFSFRTLQKIMMVKWNFEGKKYESIYSMYCRRLQIFATIWNRFFVLFSSM